MNDMNLLDRLHKSCNQNKVTEVIFGSIESLNIRVVKNLKTLNLVRIQELLQAISRVYRPTSHSHRNFCKFFSGRN